MKDRVKIDIVEDGQVVDTVGADKGEKLDEYQKTLEILAPK